MGLKTFFGTLLGFTIGFLILGFWRGAFNWNLWIFLSIGGAIGGTIVRFAFPTIKKTIEENKEEEKP